MKLTLRQQEVLNLLIDYQRKHGFPPTTYELTGMLGCLPQCGSNPPEGTGEKRGHHNHPRGIPRYQHHSFGFPKGAGR